MNLTIGNTNIGRHIKVWQVAVAGGLALAISVAALAGAVERDSSPESATVAQPVAPVSSAPAVAANTIGSRSVGPIMEEPDFGAVSIESAPAVIDPNFGTGAESVSAIEGDYLGIAQADMVVVDPYFGTGAESVSAIEGDQLPND